MPMRLKISEQFFDRAKVLNASARAKLDVLSKLGAYIRTTARRSMRYRKKASAPGTPPSAHKGTIRDLLFFAYDVAEGSVVVGPVLSGKPTGAPELLEKGGAGLTIHNPRRTVRKLGKAGEIRIVTSKQLARLRKSRLNHSWLKKNKDGEWVAYRRLGTPAEVARSNAINKQLYGPDVIKGVRVAARPFMGPAAAKETSKMGSLWQNSIKE